jgi:hypothetical protein
MWWKSQKIRVEPRVRSYHPWMDGQVQFQLKVQHVGGRSCIALAIAGIIPCLWISIQFDPRVIHV